MHIKRGFTLVELIVSVSIFALLATIGSLRFFSSYSQVNLSSALDILVSDIKTAQSNAMSGYGVGGSRVTGWGFKKTAANSYVIYPGVAYVAGSPYNITSSLPLGITLTTAFPFDEVIFSQISGEIPSLLGGQNTLTLTSDLESRTITLNKYGSIIGD